MTMTPSRLPITDLPTGEVTPAVIVCGDPGRADLIAAQLDDATPLCNRREYRAYRGHSATVPITVCSHGIGAPGAAIAFEELIVAGAQRIIRVGTCGGLQPDIVPGELIVAHAAVQNTGYGRETAPDGYPATADPALTLALARAAAGTNHSVRSGIVLSRDNFYPGLPGTATPDYRTMSAARVLAVEMECAALFLVGGLRGVATAAILVTDGNVLNKAESVASYQPGQAVVRAGVEAAVHCALAALTGIHDRA